MNGTIQKWGNSQAIRLPKNILETALIQENDNVQIIAQENKIILLKLNQTIHKTLKERLKDFDGAYNFEEWNTGNSVGSEIF